MGRGGGKDELDAGPGRSAHSDDRSLLTLVRQGDEQALIARIRESDVAAFDLVYTHYYPRLLEFAYRYLRSREAAEDIVQETMFAIWHGRDHWQVTRGLGVYLYGAVRNRSLQVARHLGMVRQVNASAMMEDFPGLEAQARPDIQAETTDLREAILRAIEVLSDSQKRVLLLRWQDELTSEQIGQVLGISAEAAQKQVRRAEGVLRALLEGKL